MPNPIRCSLLHETQYKIVVLGTFIPYSEATNLINDSFPINTKMADVIST